MQDLFKRFWERAVSEGGVIQGAPFTFGIAVVILTVAGVGLAWVALDWKYGSVVAARDAQIGLLAAQVKDLTDKNEELKKNSPPLQSDPDSIYQGGKIVGKTVGAIPDVGSGKIYFRMLNTNGEFNRSVKFKYREMDLKLEKSSSEAYSSMAGEERRQFTDAQCSIIAD